MVPLPFGTTTRIPDWRRLPLSHCTRAFVAASRTHDAGWNLRLLDT